MHGVQAISNHTMLRTRITSILISRFLFHLQAVERKTHATSTHPELSTNDATTGTLIFQRAVGSIASSLPPEEFGTEDFEEDYENSQDADDGTLPALGSVHDTSTGTSNENTAAVAPLESAA